MTTTPPRVEAAERRREFRALLRRSSLGGRPLTPQEIELYAARVLAVTEPPGRDEVLEAMTHESHCRGYGVRGPLTRISADCGCIAGESVDRLVDAGLLEVDE